METSIIFARRAPSQASRLEAIDHRDEIRLLDRERIGGLRLAHAWIELDDGQHGILRRSDVQLCERFIEVLKHRDLGPPECVPDAIVKRAIINSAAAVYGAGRACSRLSHLRTSALPVCSLSQV